MRAQPYIQQAWRALGQVAAQLARPVLVGGAPHTAGDCFAESLRICAEQHLERERAHTLREWARYALAQGEQARGRALWQEARATFERLGMALEVQRMDACPTPGG